MTTLPEAPTSGDTQEELQWLFDVSLNHIRKQGGPSVSERGSCRYKGPNGLSCAAEPFILEYSEEMEGINFPRLLEQFDTGIFHSVAVKHVGFVSRLQRIHDTASKSPGGFWFSYEMQMKYLATHYSLSYEPLGESQ